MYDIQLITRSYSRIKYYPGYMGCKNIDTFNSILTGNQQTSTIGLYKPFDYGKVC